jgi:hypothetical protein
MKAAALETMRQLSNPKNANKIKRREIAITNCIIRAAFQSYQAVIEILRTDCLIGWAPVRRRE